MAQLGNLIVTGYTNLIGKVIINNLKVADLEATHLGVGGAANQSYGLYTHSASYFDAATTFNDSATFMSDLLFKSTTSDTNGYQINNNGNAKLGKLGLGTNVDTNYSLSLGAGVKFANGTKNLVGDDVYIGDANVTGTLGVMGVNGATGIRLLEKSGTWSSGAGPTWTWVAADQSSMSGHFRPLTNNTQNLGTSDYKWKAVYATSFEGKATSAGTADSATNDSSGNNIASTYAKKDGTNASGTWGININGSSASCTGNSATATTLQTSRTIAINTGAIGTATSFNGSSNITIPVTSLKEAYLDFGGKNLTGLFSACDAALIPVLGANRLAGFKAAGTTVEYSLDGGSTWTDYGLTDDAKVGIFTNSTTVKIAGPDTAKGSVPNNAQVRITIDGVDGGVYTQLKKLAIYVTTNGSTDPKIKMESSKYSDSSTFTTIIEDMAIAEYWNILNFTLPGSGSFGGSSSSSHQRKIRLTFSHASCSANSIGLQIFKIYGYGGVGWTTPSTVAYYGTPYIYDNSFNIQVDNGVYPKTTNASNLGLSNRVWANVYATNFRGALIGNATSASYPEGFSSRKTSASWGNQTGTTVTCWNESAGGSVEFRKNNPSSGKVSLKLDGRFYGNEGANPAMLMNTDDTYWGLGDPDGTKTVWIRTTSLGLLPYQAGVAGSGHSSLGTSSWYFANAYIDNIYGSLTGNATTATGANIATTTNAVAKYVDGQGTFSDSGVTIDANNNITTSGYIYAEDVYANLKGLADSTISVQKALNVSSVAVTTKNYTYGTAGVTSGTRIYSKWYVNLDSGTTTLTDGMIICIKIPIAGSSSGSCVTLDGTNFHPVVYATNSSVTTHYGVNTKLLLVYDSTGTGSVYGNSTGTGSTSAANITGVWRVLNMYNTDDNTIPSAYCSTAASTAAKVASCTNYNLATTQWIHIIFTQTNTVQTNVTLNINSKGAKSIYLNGAAISSTNYNIPAGTYLAYYDGTNYNIRTDGTLPGNSLTASTLQTNRTFTIGNSGKTFNGSADVTWTLADIGAAASSHSHAASDITSGKLALDRIPIGTTASTVALGNHTHDYAASNHTHTISDITNLSLSWSSITDKPTTFNPSTHTHTVSDITNLSLSWSSITNKPSTFTPSTHTHNYLPLSGGTLTGGVNGPRFWANQGTAERQVGVSYDGTATGSLYFWASPSTGTAGIYDSIGGHILQRDTTSTSGKYNIWGEKVYGAVWNDYAEYRESDITEPGRVVIENGDDTLILSTERLQRGCEIISDTFGFAIGETDNCKTPIAASGRVLAYTYEDREEFKSHIGWPVCSGPNGTVSIMTEEEEEKYPSRIIGVISAVPEYETWGSNNVHVNGRVWIRIK